MSRLRVQHNNLYPEYNLGALKPDCSVFTISPLHETLYLNVFVDLDKERPQLKLLAACGLEGLFLLEHRDQGLVN